jgi:hypothetical protein
MRSPSATRRSGACLAIALGLALLLPVLYMASVGPAARLVVDGRVSNRAYRVAYGPLQQAANCWGPTSKVLDRYLELWGALPRVITWDAAGQSMRVAPVRRPSQPQADGNP